MFPIGEPYSLAERMIYEPGATRSVQRRRAPRQLPQVRPRPQRRGSTPAETAASRSASRLPPASSGRHRRRRADAPPSRRPLPPRPAEPSAGQPASRDTTWNRPPRSSSSSASSPPRSASPRTSGMPSCWPTAGVSSRRAGPPAGVRDGRGAGSFVTVAGAVRRRHARALGVAQPALARRDLDHRRGLRPAAVLARDAWHRRRARAVREPVRVHRRVRDVDPRRLPVPRPALPDPPDRVHPRRRRRSRCCCYASSLPSEIEPLVPALQNAPLLTIHVGMAVLAYGIFATAFAAGIGYLVQGTDRPNRAGCRRTRRSTRSRTGRSSSASRSSRR